MRTHALILALLLPAASTLSVAEPTVPEESPFVTEEEARTVAENWVAGTIRSTGRWGDSAQAAVVSVMEIWRGDRVIGYYCDVVPQGFVIVSFRRELAPVKAYSDSSCFDPASDEGMADAITTGILQEVAALETAQAQARASGADSGLPVLETDYGNAWRTLLAGPQEYRTELEAQSVLLAASSDTVLLSSNWHQYEPYNNSCPYLACQDIANGRAPAGCIATAAAQIMRYWGWPPYGNGSPYDSGFYDWANMPDEYTTFFDPVQERALARLSSEAGVAAGMDYECDGSSAGLANKPGKDMLDGFENNFRYDSAADEELRSSHTVDGWFGIVQENIDANQPMQYAIPTDWLAGGHSMVLDGWRIYREHRQYHMNYGWGDNTKECGHSANYWYTIDSLCNSTWHLQERMIRNLRPANTVGTSLSGTYDVPSFPYRYFARNATGSNASFSPGQSLQFLPGVAVTCSSPGPAVRFSGSSTSPTRLYAVRGGPAKSIRLAGSHIFLYSGGGIRFGR